jgi:hypothetical protein
VDSISLRTTASFALLRSGQWILLALLGPGDETVERHRDVSPSVCSSGFGDPHPLDRLAQWIRRRTKGVGFNVACIRIRLVAMFTVDLAHVIAVVTGASRGSSTRARISVTQSWPAHRPDVAIDSVTNESLASAVGSRQRFERECSVQF